MRVRTIVIGNTERIRPSPKHATSRRTFLGALVCAGLASCYEPPSPENLLEFGVRVSRLSGEVLVSEKPDMVLPAASVSKLLIAIALLDAIAASNGEPPGQRLAKTKGRLSSGDIRALHDMIVISDNRAANALIARIGHRRINEMAKSLGLATLRIEGTFLEIRKPVAPKTFITARDGEILLRHICQRARDDASPLNPYSYLVRCMSTQSDHRFLRFVLPDSIAVAEKTGEIHNELNDLAIIDPYGTNPVLFAVLARGTFDVHRDPRGYSFAVHGLVDKEFEIARQAGIAAREVVRRPI